MFVGEPGFTRRALAPLFAKDPEGQRIVRLAFDDAGVAKASLFPKAQPPRIGPLKPPPGPVISVGLYGAWIGVTVLLSAILAGGIF